MANFNALLAAYIKSIYKHDIKIVEVKQTINAWIVSYTIPFHGYEDQVEIDASELLGFMFSKMSESK